MADHLVNPHALRLAKARLQKLGFVPPGDPAMTGGDPAAAGGAPPGGGMPPGGDPAAMGGAPPMDPAMMGGGGGGGGSDPALGAILAKLEQMGGGGAAGGTGPGGEAIKPKIDVNIELMQIKNMLAQIADALGVPISATSMVGTSDKLMQMAQNPGQTPQTGGGAGGQPAGGISPVPPMPGMDAGPGAMPKTGSYGRGAAFIGNNEAAGQFADMSQRASAIMGVMGRRRRLTR